MNPRKWGVQWRSLTMPAPSFFYYPTRREAREAAKRLRSHYGAVARVYRALHPGELRLHRVKASAKSRAGRGVEG
jgi:hypothetical protein